MNSFRKAVVASSLVSLTALLAFSQQVQAATRPVRPGGSTPPPTVVNPDPPPRPSQMVAGRNSGNMLLGTPLSAASRTVAPAGTSVKATTDP